MNIVRNRALIVAIAGVGLAWPSVAQCGAATWFGANTFPGANGPILCTTNWDPDGPGPASPVVVVGGNFTVAGATVTGRVAWWDGANWHGVGAGQLTGQVKALTVFNGDLVAASYIDGFVRWNGTTWQAMAGGPPEFGGTALAVYNGVLYTGSFYTGVSCWTGSGWLPVPGSSFTSVRGFTVYNGDLVVCGVQGASFDVATWNGTTWTTLGSGFGASVRAVTVHNGSLVAGGDFGVAGGVPANRVARWTGSAWQAVGAGLPGFCEGLEVWNGNLFAAIFSNVGSFNVGSVWQWDGVAWQSIGSTQSVLRVNAFSTLGGDLWAVGDFYSIGGISARGIAHWNGVSWSRASNGFNASPTAFVSHGGDLVAAGPFTVAGSVDSTGFARFDGSAWQDLGGGGPPDNSYKKRALLSYNGELIAGGDFPSIGNVSTPGGVAGWDGSSWHGFGAGLSVNNPATIGVHALAEFNGEFVAGGVFHNSAGTPLNYVARWNGASWLPFGAGMNGPVSALQVHNGELYAGGAFSTAGSVPAANVAKWNGAVWQPLGVGIAGQVLALTVYGNDLVAGGNFASAGSVPAIGIARWNGMSWSSFDSTGNSGVRALAVFESDLYAASIAWGLSTGTTPLLARWNGSSWLTVGSGLTLGGGGVDIGITALAAHRGALFVAGDLRTADGIVTPLLARWSRPLPLVSFQQTGSGSVLVTDAWLIPGHEYYNLGSLDLCPAGPGTGPNGGLCANDPNVLLQQALLPLGAAPFHFAASATTETFGPYSLPPGLALDVISFDFTGGTLGCISWTTRHTVQ